MFTKKRLIKFNVQYDLEVNKECLNETSYKTLDYFTDNFNVSTPANITLSSFSRGIKGVWTLTLNVSCYEGGRIKGFCHFEPRRTKALRPRDFRKEVKESIEEMGYVVFYRKESSVVMGFRLRSIYPRVGVCLRVLSPSLTLSFLSYTIHGKWDSIYCLRRSKSS